MLVYSSKTGLRRLKPEGSPEKLKEKYPDMIFIQEGKKPSIQKMTHWISDGVARALDGCKVEPDGYCPHGLPSWLIALRII